MKVNVIGGGPGGLYASILLKKANPDWEITVYERDPAENTYGWGIVFSVSTLGALREADYESTSVSPTSSRAGTPSTSTTAASTSGVVATDSPD